MTGLSRSVHHTPHDSNIHLLHTWITLSPDRHLPCDVGLDLIGQLLKIGALSSATTGTGGHLGQKTADTHRLQNLLTNTHLFSPVGSRHGRQRHADGISYSLLEKYGQGN